MKQEYLTLEDVKESFASQTDKVVSLTHAGRFFVVSRRNGRIYTESPEEQGQGEGPRLLRVFPDMFDAKRYQEALEGYVGERLEIESKTLPEIKKFATKAVKQGCRIQVCRVPEGEWPQVDMEITALQMGRPN